MTDTVVIEGEVSLVNQVEGEVELNNRIDGDPNVLIVEGGSQPTGTKSILLTEAGTKTEDVTDYASAEINAVTDATASGAVASFSDGAEDVPMDSCVADIEPVQSGSGDPSPSNVRPISGWSTVNVYVSPTLSAQDATVHTVSLGQTVYGGTLDVVSGVLTVTHGFWVVNESYTWTKSSAYPGGFYGQFQRTLGYKNKTPFKCSHAKSALTTSDYLDGTCYCDSALNFRLMEANSTLQDWKDYITEQKNNGTPITICFELATPTTVQLSPTEVTTLLGSNNVWADSGSISVGYKADIFLYAEGGVTPTGTKQITANGTNIDVYNYQYADVAVPNSYSAGDEGKVVSNGALVAQTSDTVTANNTYDTTLINSLTVNVSGGGGYTVDEIASLAVPSGEITINITSLSRDGLRSRPITRVYAPNLKSIAQYAFSGTSLTRIEPTDFPNSGLKAFPGAFESITTLTYAKLTNPLTGTTAIAYAFRGCTNLVECYLPYATTNIDRTCNGCRKLQIFDGGSGNISNSSSFQYCSALRTLILRKTDGVQTLNAWSANCLGGIYSNPTESTVYVPQALISSYQTATNWSSAYSAGVTFAAIEGSIYEL